MRKWMIYVLTVSLFLACAGCAKQEAETPTNASTVLVSSQKEQQDESVVSSASAVESAVEQQEETSSKETASKESKPPKESSVPASSKVPVQSSQPTPSENTSSAYKPTYFEPLTEAKIKEITACVEKDNYEYGENQYFGTYNGYHVLLVSQINGV